jgi:pimeloyl-ACP methyl ester carboxylesterase
MVATPDFSRELARVSVPARLIWGDRDGFASRTDQERLLGAIAGARLMTYEGAGHAMHWEEPARFANDVLEFVREHCQVGRRAIMSPSCDSETPRSALSCS